MTLSDVSSIGSLVSGLAVLASLIYLSLQVRQTERNQRALMNQGVITRSVEQARWATEPHIADLVRRTASGEGELSEQDIAQLRLLLRSSLIAAQDGYVQHAAGLIDEITFDTSLAAIKSMMARPVNRALWKSARTTYAPEWTTYIDKLIEEVPLARPVDEVARFKADLAEVLR